jgi:FixJ family two-component response regulator
MSPLPNRETAINQCQRVELPTIPRAIPNCRTPRTMAEVNARVVVHSGITSSQSRPIVFVVDDDVSVRQSLASLICSARYEPQTFGSVQEFLCHEPALVPSCLVLDTALPGQNCLDLQKRLAADRKDMPIIFATNHGDVAMTVQAMKAGVFDFLTKPFCDDMVLSAIRGAIECSRTVLDHDAEMRGSLDCYASLSRREREVMAFVVSGLLNKQVGFELGISEITVKAHRGRVMRKMKATSLAGLIKMAMKVGVLAGA